MTAYIPSELEATWQGVWEKEGINRTSLTAQAGQHEKNKKNTMVLVEFPYPSGDLHMGHWYAFALPDMVARARRMQGEHVMYPIGFDAFGLPAENAAIKNGVHPRAWTEGNIERMSTQLRSMGAMFDWSRTVSTIDPDYYRWTQWIFAQMFRQGLVYRAKTKVNWCPSDKTVLANEQVVQGHCERCGSEVVQRDLEQWMMRITKYADRLIDDIEGLDWPRTTVLAQQNWIGRSKGARISWRLVGVPGQEDGAHTIETFTTRPDTVYGVTFLVISPELAQKWIDVGWQAPESVGVYIRKAMAKRELERAEQSEKTGVDTQLKAVHPLTGQELPVWVADYVLGGYGTGAIMAVPAHDERDRAFAKAFDLPVSDAPLTTDAVGEAETTYRLRDWILSRQRYWGAPIPMVHCDACGWTPVPDDELPVKLPDLEDYLPTDDGKSPLAKVESFVRTTCPSCKGEARRETDTMDTFVDSSWYFLRYTDPANTSALADAEAMKAWLPVSLYVGGSEHNTMHLLYARFITKALYDMGHVPTNEPFTARRNHGFVLGPDGQKMSKSKGNVVNPDAEVATHGADAVRLYLAFKGPYDQDGPWDPKGISGVVRFLQRVWALAHVSCVPQGSQEADRALHGATKAITADLAVLSLNTCVSGLMKLLNALEGTALSAEQLGHLVRLLAPFAPHMAEALWRDVLGHKTSVHVASWPEVDESLLIESTMTIPVQVNGRVRAVLTVSRDAGEDDVLALARQDEQVAKYLDQGTVQKTIYIPGKLVNLVVT